MRENKIKLREGIYLAPFICGFFYFMYIFIKVPVIDDRWMESWAYYDLQDTWRVLFTQIWISKMFRNGWPKKGISVFIIGGTNSFCILEYQNRSIPVCHDIIFIFSTRCIGKYYAIV